MKENGLVVHSAILEPGHALVGKAKPGRGVDPDRAAKTVDSFVRESKSA